MNTIETTDKIVIETGAAPIYTILWLHGLGASGHDFVPVVRELNLLPPPALRFIFPHAPLIPVTINGGYVMRAWYDIISTSIEQHADSTGIKSAINQVNSFIKTENSNGVPPENIILAGFSQGAVIALAAGLQYPERLGGILALSGYLPNPQQAVESAHPANRNTPVFIGHGKADSLVPFALGESVFTILKKAHWPVHFYAYPIQHTVSAEEINDIRQWIADRSGQLKVQVTPTE